MPPDRKLGIKSVSWLVGLLMSGKIQGLDVVIYVLESNHPGLVISVGLG